MLTRPNLAAEAEVPPEDREAGEERHGLEDAAERAVDRVRAGDPRQRGQQERTEGDEPGELPRLAPEPAEAQVVEEVARLARDLRGVVERP